MKSSSKNAPVNSANKSAMKNMATKMQQPKATPIPSTQKGVSKKGK